MNRLNSIHRSAILYTSQCFFCGQSQTVHPFVGLTRFFDVGAPLVHGGAQGGGADVQHADLVHAGVEHPQRVLLVLLVVAEDFAIDEGGKHLGLQEAGQEGQIGLRLVGEEGSLGGTASQTERISDSPCK